MLIGAFVTLFLVTQFNYAFACSSQPPKVEKNIVILGHRDAKNIVILGPPGSGKSSLANTLLGRSANYDGGYYDGCFKTGKFHWNQARTTRKACYEAGYYLGDYTKGFAVNIVDSGDLSTEEGESSLKDILDNYLPEIDAFLITIKESDNRWTDETTKFFKNFQAMFGYKVWEHVTLVGTFWSMDAKDISLREQQNRTEKWFYETWNKAIIKNFLLYTTLKTVFIDTHHTKDALEVTSFQNNTLMLATQLKEKRNRYHWKKP